MNCPASLQRPWLRVGLLVSPKSRSQMLRTFFFFLCSNGGWLPSKKKKPQKKRKMTKTLLVSLNPLNHGERSKVKLCNEGDKSINVH